MLPSPTSKELQDEFQQFVANLAQLQDSATKIAGFLNYDQKKVWRKRIAGPLSTLQNRLRGIAFSKLETSDEIKGFTQWLSEEYPTTE